MPIRSVLPGWPSYMGSHKFVVVEMKGLAAYTAAAHETLDASQFGCGGFESVEVENKGLTTVNAQLVVVPLSYSGTYFVTATFAAGAVGAQRYVTLKWFTTATGVEVVGPTDLSAETARLRLIMV